MSSSSAPKATKSYRKAVVDLLDTNFSKLNSVLEGCLEVFARKAFEAKLISEQVMKDKSFIGMISEFKAGMEWCRNTLEIQSRCTDFIEILESLGGPAKTAGQDLYVKLLILDEKHEVFSVEPHPCEGTQKVVNLLHMRIEQVPELAVIAAGLKKKFRQLLIIVKKSLANVDISDVKVIISSTLVDNSCRVSDTIRLYLYKLRKFEKVEEILDFLIEYRFIGYLNYGLLKEISNLTNDENISKAFNSYETEHFCNLLKSSKFNLLMQVFCEYPDLSPTTAIGLPEIMFQLEDSWKNESMETWQRYMEINFPWSGSLAVKEVSASCILITYVCYPAKYNDILKDLCNPDILERLKSDEISVHILESETTVALQHSVAYDFEVDNIQMVEAIQCEELFNKDRRAEPVVSAPSLKNWMPNKASEHVDWAYAHVHNILDLQCQISQLITRVDETDKKLGQLNKQFETRNDEIMQTMLANGKKDIDELSEKLKASQVEVDELKQNLSDMQGQLNQSIDEIKKDMADLSRVHPANDAPPSGNQPQPTFNETMDKLRRKLDHFTDSLIPKEASQRRRSIIQSHRNETRQNYRPRPQSLLLESSLSETMDSPVLQRSHSASSTGSSGLGTLPDQQSGKSLPAIGEQNIHLSFLNSSTFFKEFSPLGPNAVSERRRPVIQSHRNDNRPFPQSQLLESKTMDFLEHPSTSSTSSGRDSLSHQPSLESLLEIGITEQPSQGPLPEIHITEQDSASLLPNESSQMRYQISTSALFASQQSNEISFETQHIIEVLWAMGDLVDHLKNLAGNFVGNTSDTYKKPDN